MRSGGSSGERGDGAAVVPCTVTEDPGQLGREMVALCAAQGFALAGVTDAAPTRWARALAQWLSAGKHGSMGYLAEHLEVRLDPRRLLEGARSVVMVADLYAARGPAEGELPVGHGRIARYARGRDYHVVIKKRLHALADALRARYPSAAFRAFVDTAPVLEREHAARAGMGWIGKHTLLIHPRLGSYTLLGGVATTLALAAPAEQVPVADHCGTCTRCIDACPTGAISPYSVDASRCVSYLTIERRAPIPREFHAAIGEWIYGCDVCQDVCPHNSPRPDGGRATEDLVNGEYAPRRSSLDVLEVLAWSAADRSAAFSGSAMKRATLEMMKRNAAIVAGNALRRRDDPALRLRLLGIAADTSETDTVRAAARLAAGGSQ